MVNLTINNKAVSVSEGTTILEAAKKAGFMIPTLCFMKDLNEIGACRICCVEIEGKDTLVSSCNTLAEEGMVVYTNSPKARYARRMNLQFILSEHDYKCASCFRNGSCPLQKICSDMNINNNPYKQHYEPNIWDQENLLLRDADKCIKCMRCVQVCEKIQTIGVWDMINTGQRTTVGISGHKDFEETDCALCGQCIKYCPTGALHMQNDVYKLVNAIHDPDKIVVAQVAPAVRAAWGEGHNLPYEESSEKRLAAAIRALGVDYVFDTNFSADLTIMEEANELLERLKDPGKHKWPMFTSCCPAWVRFMKSQYPDMVSQLSTAKSPQQMFGAITKSYFAEKILEVDPENVFCVSIMPCTAKKGECEIPTINGGAVKDVDVVLHTREFSRVLRSELIDPALLEDEEFDSPLGTGSGAGVIFGTTGGVMEAALRTAWYLVNKSNPDPDQFKIVRGPDSIKEAEVVLGGIPVRAAVVSGLGNARKLIEKIREGEASYDFVEVMACPGGCAKGCGQPIRIDRLDVGPERGEILYQLDRDNPIRFSHENPSIVTLYRDYLDHPLSHKSHELLHTDHYSWKMPAENYKAPSAPFKTTQ